MIIRNKKSLHEQVVTPDEWKAMGDKKLEWDQNKTFQSLFEIVSHDANALPIANANIPTELKVFKGEEGTSRKAEQPKSPGTQPNK